MADITKCTGESCHVRDVCMRFTIPPKPDGQSWMSPPKWIATPLCMQGFGMKCPFFIANELYVKRNATFFARKYER